MQPSLKTTPILTTLFFALLFIAGTTFPAQAQQVQVAAADPNAAEQGTINLNVKVTGKGFKSGANAKWFVTGTTNPGGVTVNSTTFVSSTQLTANITVSDTAVIANFDIQVLNKDGRGGKGTELFAVTAKGGGNASCPAMQPAPASDTKCYDIAAGCLDWTFGGTGTGIVHTDPDGLPNVNGGRAIAVQPDGKIVVGGTARSSSGEGEIAVVRYHSDGSPDTSFGDPDPLNPPLRRGIVVTSFSTNIYDMLLQPDGKIVIAGEVGSGAMVAVRYNADGTLDLTFGSGGMAEVRFGSKIGAYLKALALQADGKVLLAGHVTDKSNQTFALARLNPDGSLDSSFATSGKLIANPTGVNNGSNFIYGITLQRIPAFTGEERIIVAGQSVQNSGGVRSWTLMRFHADGTTDTTFGISGVVKTAFFGFDALARRVKIDTSNRIVAAGEVYTSDCGTYTVDFGIVRYTQDGALDGSFSGGKQTVNVYGGIDSPWGLVFQPDDKILIAGHSASSDNTIQYFALVRFNVNGTRDTSFGSLGNGVVTTAPDWSYVFGNAATSSADGKIIVTGGGSKTQVADIVVARYWP